MSSVIPPAAQIMPNRGEIWTVQLVGVGHEQQGTRPVLIISENAINHSGFRLVVAIPITTNTDRYSSRVLVNPPEGGLTRTSAIMCEQILRLDIDAFKRTPGQSDRADSLQSNAETGRYPWY